MLAARLSCAAGGARGENEPDSAQLVKERFCHHCRIRIRTKKKLVSKSTFGWRFVGDWKKVEAYR